MANIKITEIKNHHPNFLKVQVIEVGNVSLDSKKALKLLLEKAYSNTFKVELNGNQVDVKTKDNVLVSSVFWKPVVYKVLEFENKKKLRGFEKISELQAETYTAFVTLLKRSIPKDYVLIGSTSKAVFFIGSKNNDLGELGKIKIGIE